MRGTPTILAEKPLRPLPFTWATSVEGPPGKGLPIEGNNGQSKSEPAQLEKPMKLDA